MITLARCHITVQLSQKLLRLRLDARQKLAILTDTIEYNTFALYVTTGFC